MKLQCVELGTILIFGLAGAMTAIPRAARAQDAAGAPPAEALADRLAALEKQVRDANRRPAGASELKLSGYLQGRYEWHDDAHYGVDAAGKPLESDRFYVRRGRVKAAHRGELSELVLQVDATGDGVALRDAEASLVLDRAALGGSRAWELKLTVGQFKLPFGYEIVESSSERDMPERTLTARTLFPGERDRGARALLRMDFVRAAIAWVNGNFTNDKIYGTYDQTGFKDVVGRLGVDFGVLAGGVSAHYGRVLVTKLGTAATATTPATPPSYTRFGRLRLGADVELRAATPGVGDLAVTAEVVLAKDTNKDFDGVPANSCLDVTSYGWYVGAVQKVGKRLGLVGRVDQFDANRGVDAACAAQAAAAEADRVTTIGGGVAVYLSANLKMNVVYEHIAEQAPRERANDVLTAQMQARF